MNTQLFGQSSLSCPVCNQAQIKKDRLQSSGLVLCKYCHDRIVVSWSGSFVRDPFVFGSIETQIMLRRQSHPLIRIVRDWSFLQKGEWMKFVGGLVVVSLLWTGLFRLATVSKTLKPSPISAQPAQVSGQTSVQGKKSSSL